MRKSNGDALEGNGDVLKGNEDAFKGNGDTATRKGEIPMGIGDACMPNRDVPEGNGEDFDRSKFDAIIWTSYNKTRMVIHLKAGNIQNKNTTLQQSV